MIGDLYPSYNYFSQLVKKTLQVDQNLEGPRIVVKTSKGAILH